MKPEQNTVTPPVIINGQIELEGDVDYFTFTAEKEQRLIFEVTAQTPWVKARRLADPFR